MGFLQSDRAAGNCSNRSHCLGARTRERTKCRACHHKTKPARGMEHGNRCGHRSGGGSPGEVHEDRRLRACIPGVLKEGKAAVSGKLTMGDESYLDWPFFDDA